MPLLAGGVQEDSGAPDGCAERVRDGIVEAVVLAGLNVPSDAILEFLGHLDHVPAQHDPRGAYAFARFKGREFYIAVAPQNGRIDGIDKTQQVVILGAGGTGLLIADSVLRGPGSSLVGFLDDNVEKKSVARGRFPVLGALPTWKALPRKCCFISSLYGPKRNVEFYLKIRSLGIPDDRWANVVDPSAIVSSFATLGYGVYVGPATVLEPNVSLGNWCAMLGGVHIAHDTCIDAYTACANSVSVAGGVRVGPAAFIGANATVREYLQIGRSTVIGMGAVVVRDIPEGSIAVGNPCRITGKTVPRESLREQSERVDIHDKLARVPIKDVEKPSGASGVVTPENQKGRL